MPASYSSVGGGVAVAAGHVPPHMMAFSQQALSPSMLAYGANCWSGPATQRGSPLQAPSIPRDGALAPGRTIQGACSLCNRSRRTTVVLGEDGRAYCKVCRLQQTGTVKAWHSVAKGADMTVDSDEEIVGLCKVCSLPLGERVYYYEDTRSTVHGECMAAQLVRGCQESEEERQTTATKQKQENRAAFDIGWKAERIPRNITPARKLACELSSENALCCLVLEGDQRSLRVTESDQTAASVNLEYLSLALRVRQSEGREPLFSLDPVDLVRDPQRLMQAKRFEPPWLMGTSAGEVMFQADYYLKELSMGEYEQPVVGMKSCFDFSEAEGHTEEWNAREWFVVRGAEVRLNADKLLVPSVQMGVEAREVLAGPDGLEDAPLTRSDHPLVKYAEEFTRNFDLIAERRSAVYHLRELAKASVLAKFLIESKVELDPSWFNLIKWDEVKAAAEECHLEVPQLWKDRLHSQLGLQDGVIQETRDSAGRKNSVYGGVAFGLERLTVAMPVRLPTNAMVPLAANNAALLSGLITGAAVEEAVITSVSEEVAMTLMYQPVEAGLPTRALPARAAFVGMPSRLSAARFTRTARVSAGISASAVKGVDLNLDEFDLTAPTEAEGCCKASLAGNGKAFWAQLEDGSNTSLDDLDLGLLKEVFNPFLSDRRAEGEAFTGPDPSESYLARLQSQICEEGRARQRRLNHFSSVDFCVGDAGPLFPASWTSNIKLASSGSHCELEPCLFEDDLRLKEESWKASNPTFDETTEDGLRFRIYRHQGFEVRTTTGPDSKEVVRATFSMTEPAKEAILGCEGVVKASLYVSAASLSCNGKQRARYHLLLETASGKAIVTEKLESGVATWEEQPSDLAGRQSAAKALGSADCVPGGITVGDLRRYASASSASTPASDSDRKKYAQGALAWLRGEAQLGPLGVARVMQKVEKAERGQKPQQGKQKKDDAQPGTFEVAPARGLAREHRLAALLEAGVDAFGADREVVLAAVALDGLALRRASAELRADREVVLAAVRSNGTALQFAAEHLRGDREIATANARALAHASEALRREMGDGQPIEAPFHVGDIVRASFVHDHWFLATVELDNGDGSFELSWFDGDSRHRVKRAEDMKLMRFNRDLQLYEVA